MTDLRSSLAQVSLRQLHLLGGLALLAAAIGLWLGALRAPFASLRELYAERDRLTAAGADLRELETRATALDASVRALAGRLGTETTAGQQLTLIREIGALAASHGVALAGVKPMPRQQALVFRQSGFDVEAVGNYEALLAWLEALERTHKQLAVAGFDMQPNAAGKVDMRVRIASYSMEGGS